MRRRVRAALAALATLACLAAPGAASAQEALEQARVLAGDAVPDNGRLIYLAGYNLKVERIQFLGGPQWLQMHGGSCASCHGPGGRGGMYPLQCDLRTPPVDMTVLAGADPGRPRHGAPYTPAALRTALEKSRDPDGRALDPCMPRWYLGDGDFRDLVWRLLTMGER